VNVVPFLTLDLCVKKIADICKNVKRKMKMKWIIIKNNWKKFRWWLLRVFRPKYCERLIEKLFKEVNEEQYDYYT